MCRAKLKGKRGVYCWSDDTQNLFSTRNFFFFFFNWQPMQFMYQSCYVSSLTFLQNKPCCTVLNTPQLTYLFCGHTGISIQSLKSTTTFTAEEDTKCWWYWWCETRKKSKRRRPRAWTTAKYKPTRFTSRNIEFESPAGVINDVITVEVNQNSVLRRRQCWRTNVVAESSQTGVRNGGSVKDLRQQWKHYTFSSAILNHFLLEQLYDYNVITVALWEAVLFGWSANKYKH